MRSLFHKYDTPRKKKRNSERKSPSASINVFSVILLDDKNRDTPLNKKEFTEHVQKSLVKEPVALSKFLAPQDLYQELQKRFNDK